MARRKIETDEELAACIFKKLDVGNDKKIITKNIMYEIEQLDIKHKRIIMLYHREGMTFKQIGAELGFSGTYARSLYRRALYLLSNHSYLMYK